MYVNYVGILCFVNPVGLNLKKLYFLRAPERVSRDRFPVALLHLIKPEW